MKRLTNTFHRRIGRTHRSAPTLLILLLVTVLLSSCADKKDTASSCLTQLDEEKYQAVAENSNCSNYERASGYLGLAGLSFTNFMKSGATDNLTKTLGISKLDNASDYSSGNRKYLTKALCMVGPDNITTSSRCGLTTSGSRSNSEKELSMFGLIGDLIYVNYGVLDNDSNGTISTTETNNFSNLQTTGVDSSGNGTTFNTSNNSWELITSSSRFIYNDNLTFCVTFNDNFTVTPTSANTNGAISCASNLTSATELRPIFKLDNMTDITGGANLTPKITMVSELTNVSTALNSELSAIGLSEDNSLRTSLTDGLSKLDNGGKNSSGTTCTAATALDVVYLLVKDAADNSTAGTASNLHDKNIIKLTDLTSSVDSSISVTAPDALSSITMTNVRLIYATNTSGSAYHDSYEAAHSSLYTAVKNIRSLGTETSTKGDGKVIFRELLCIGEN